MRTPTWETQFVFVVSKKKLNLLRFMLRVYISIDIYVYVSSNFCSIICMSISRFNTLKKTPFGSDVGVLLLLYTCIIIYLIYVYKHNIQY